MLPWLVFDRNSLLVDHPDIPMARDALGLCDGIDGGDGAGTLTSSTGGWRKLSTPKKRGWPKTTLLH